MSYYFTKTVSLSFEEALRKVTDELKKEGFGVLTEIDVKDTLKKKLGVEFRSYRILGACNPPFAHRALQAEDKIGLLLPCNVIVQDKGAGLTEVSAINPMETMKAVQNPKLVEVAEEVQARLRRVIDRV
ncbi:MAG: DUF302 domain-containing protein [Candidatus Eisenbacteria bacterium]